MPDQWPMDNTGTGSPDRARGIAGDIHTPRRHDSAHKHVAGTAVYVDDMRAPDDTLIVLIGQSPHAHARITGMDLSKVAAAPGVVAVLTYKDIPGKNDCSPVRGDDPILAEDIVRCPWKHLHQSCRTPNESSGASSASSRTRGQLSQASRSRSRVHMVLHIRKT